MRKQILIYTALLFSFFANAQYNILVNNSGNVMYGNSLSVVESITFDNTYSKFLITGNSSTIDIQKSLVESLTFTTSAVNLTKIYIIWNGTDNATIINPYANQGVNITASGGNVTVAATSGIANLEYNLLGTSTSGNLTMSSDQPANFVLNNLNLTNASGAAIQLTSSPANTFTLQAGTTNSLTDGSSSTKNAALQTAGAIVFNGTGSLNITGVKKHGISAASSITVNSGNITVNSAASDAFHSEGFNMNDGTVKVSASTGDGIDAGDGNIAIAGGTVNITSATADIKGIKTGTGAITFTGGTTTLTISGAQSKGISAGGNINFNGGTVSATLSGAAVLTASGSGYDTSYATAVKSDGIVTINAGTQNFIMTSTATGGRGISTVTGIVFNGGTTTVSTAGNGATYTNTSGVLDAYSSSCLKSDGYINVIGGNVTLSSSGSAGKGINADGTVTIGSSTTTPVLKVTTTGARFLVSGTDYSHPKTIVAEGAIIINSGTNTITSTDDGIHSDTSVTINGGNNNVTASSPTSGVGEGIEAPIINLAGGTNMVSASNDGLNATYGTVSGGTEQNDNSQLNISGGINIITGSDAIDSNGNITVSGGTTIVNGPTSSPEEAVDFNGNFVINGGFFIAGGSNSNMTKNFSATSTQPSMYLKSGSQLSSSSIINIQNAAGTEMVTYKPKNNVYYFHFSSPNVAKGTTYKVYFGGSYTGGSFVGGNSGWGVYTGGTYSATGATLKKSFTTSTSSTINTVTF